MEFNSVVAVVTGASRGAGLGIARALGSHGCTVYVTGRTQVSDQSPLGGTIYETAALVDAAGGTGIPVAVDHADDDQVRALFETVERGHGKLDILVNNAALIRDEAMGNGAFWEKPLNVVDNLDVGLRSSYVATALAAPLMIIQDTGLVVFTSASGAAHYMFGPAYGVAKAGTLLTRRVRDIVAADPDHLSQVLDDAETPEFTGHLIWALYNDPRLLELSGQTVIGAELAARYGIVDDGGRTPPSCRDRHGVHPQPQFVLD